MVKLAANLSLMFTEKAFVERFGAAAAAGFHAVEFMFPYDVPAAELGALVRDLGLSVVLFNTPSGDWPGGERGLAAQPDRIAEFRDGVRTALDYAAALECSRIHVMAGLLKDQTRRLEFRATLLSNLCFAAELAAKQGVEILIEPINTRYDVPGYFYDTTADALAVIDDAKMPNISLQYDIYHMQIMEGDVGNTIERLLPRIGHIQLADNPGRHEPGTGEINYGWLLPQIDALGYRGWIGCEYKPIGATEAGLGWSQPFLD